MMTATLLMFFASLVDRWPSPHFSPVRGCGRGSRENPALRSVRVLDVLSNTPARPDGLAPCLFPSSAPSLRAAVRNAGSRKCLPAEVPLGCRRPASRTPAPLTNLFSECPIRPSRLVAFEPSTGRCLPVGRAPLQEIARMKMYGKFAAMIATSTVVMFGLMYLNTYQLEHVTFSETRTYMAIVMGATMAVVMLAYMLKMYPNRRVNIGIFLGSAIVFAVALWLVRSQVTVDDVSYMKAMIPHHSIAIMTSERAQIRDPRVRLLADQIVKSQREEIAEMKALIRDLEDE
jgi:hypothetical protein